MRFFFYGTLLAGSDNPVAAQIHARLQPAGMASVKGALWAIPDPLGWFPALVADEGAGAVRGMIYEARATFDAADLARMDAYEDCDPAHADASLYLRRAFAVMPEVASGSRGEAQVYVWNRPVPDGARAIPGGDFRAWLAAEGLAQFTGLREG
ncbi:gamma-glutamylcyclotransferase family protein [Novosphingobium sp. ZN18A2]|uniref:gamma-glutamylcyclotransferase family protein n=1 Tax=Novosphingobium sp. ZN18A2 TaxID=3079861 RepID=UPI0030CF2D13